MLLLEITGAKLFQLRTYNNDKVQETLCTVSVYYGEEPQKRYKKFFESFYLLEIYWHQTKNQRRRWITYKNKYKSQLY
jgi:hypothetical protein